MHVAGRDGQDSSQASSLPSGDQHTNGLDGDVQMVWGIQQSLKSKAEMVVPVPCLLVLCIKDKGVNADLVSGAGHLLDGSYDATSAEALALSVLVHSETTEKDNADISAWKRLARHDDRLNCPRYERIIREDFGISFGSDCHMGYPEISIRVLLRLPRQKVV
jgi:hypothetical protein